MENRLTQKEAIKLLKQIQEEKKGYIRKQFSKNPYYIALRFFGSSWFWHIRQLTEYEDNLIVKYKIGGLTN